VAVIHYTFTHKQYTEYRERNIHNDNNNNLGSAGRVIRTLNSFCRPCCQIIEGFTRYSRVMSPRYGNWHPSVVWNLEVASRCIGKFVNSCYKCSLDDS
jgi:hypothetical protein